jgi:hypothetical protein
MKTKLVDTVTNNEDYVRSRIFDGDLQISEAAAELLRLERSQHEATRRELLRCREELRQVTADLELRGAQDDWW